MFHAPPVKPRHRRSRRTPRLPLLCRQERRCSKLIRSGSYHMQSSRLAEETKALISGLKLKEETYKLAIYCISEAVSSRHTMKNRQRKETSWDCDIMSWALMMDSGTRVSSRRIRCWIGYTTVALLPLRETARRLRLDLEPRYVSV